MFLLLKKAYRKHIKKRLWIEIYIIDKYDFLKAFGSIHTKAFKSTVIYNGFATTGLVPFDPKYILSKLKDTKTPTPPGSPGSDSST